MNVVASQNMIELLTRYFPHSRITNVKGLWLRWWIKD
jgi:hypothetical protein